MGGQTNNLKILFILISLAKFALNKEIKRLLLIENLNVDFLTGWCYSTFYSSTKWACKNFRNTFSTWC